MSSRATAEDATAECTDPWGVRLQIADFSRSRPLPESLVCRDRRFTQSVPGASFTELVAAMSVMACTHRYTAPELIAVDVDAHHAYGAGVDMWSYGCIFFELLTGEIFAPARTLVEILGWWVARLGPLLASYPACGV